MVVKQIKQTSANVYEITLDAGSAFFLRSEYLTQHTKEELDFICSGDDISEEFLEDMVNAGLVYNVEVKAMDYLSRAEQYRNGLYSKLLKKGFKKEDCNKALDYLESVNYLSDKRYAGAWIRSRIINHYEGKNRIFAELLSRGIDSVTAKESVEEFFAEHDELEICEKAFNKIKNNNWEKEKVIQSLQRSGFNQKIIKNILENYTEI